MHFPKARSSNIITYNINSSLNTTSKESVWDSFKIILFSDGLLVSVNKVLKLVDNLESNKSAGMDGLNGDCMKNADVITSVLLSFCFTCMLKGECSVL